MVRRLATLLVSLWATTAGAVEPAAVAQLETSAPSAWRGSALLYRNSVTALSLDRSTELTYDPRYEMTWALQPRFALTDTAYARGSLSLTRELTHSNWTTDAGEAFWGDTGLAVGSSELWRDPWLGVAFSAEAGLRLPTSKASQAQTLQVGADLSVGFHRTFELPVKVSVGYGLKMGRDLHAYTTAERESALIPGCTAGDVGDCARHRNMGLRNARYGMSNTLSLGLGLTDWLSLSAAAGLHTRWLYPAASAPEVNLVTVAPTDTRHYLSGDLGLALGPLAGLSLGLGASTFNPQQRPDSSDYTVFFNRFTQLYVDLRIDLAQLTRATMSEG